MSKPKKKCPDCGRSGPICWVMPCMALQVAIEKGPRRINRWLARVDAPFRVLSKK